MQNEFFQKLIQDHQQVNQILRELKESQESQVEKRQELFQKLREELVPHLKDEEKSFHQPLMAQNGARGEMVDHYFEEDEAEIFKGAEKVIDHDELQIARNSLSRKSRRSTRA